MASCEPTHRPLNSNNSPSIFYYQHFASCPSTCIWICSLAYGNPYVLALLRYYDQGYSPAMPFIRVLHPALAFVWSYFITSAIVLIHIYSFLIARRYCARLPSRILHFLLFFCVRTRFCVCFSARWVAVRNVRANILQHYRKYLTGSISRNWAVADWSFVLLFFRLLLLVYFDFVPQHFNTNWKMKILIGCHIYFSFNKSVVVFNVHKSSS